MNQFIKKLTHRKGVFSAMTAMPDFCKNAGDLIMASLMINVFALALPLVILQLYDRIIPYQSHGSLIWLTIGCIAAMILEAVLRLIRSLISSWWASRFEYMAGCSAIDTILHANITEFENVEVGVHLDRLNAISTLRSVYAGPVFQVMLDLPFAIIYLACIWLLAGNLVNIPLFCILLFFIFTMICRIGFSRARKSQLAGQEKRYSFIIEALGGIQTIKAIGMEEMLLRKSEKLHHENSTSENRLHFWNKLPGVAGIVLARLAMFGIILVGAKMVINGEFTLGTLAACTMLVRRGMQPFIQVAGCWLQLSDAQIALNKVRDITMMQTDCSTDLPLLPDNIDGSVELGNVYYRQQPEMPYVLENVTLSVAPRQFICITSQADYDCTTLLSVIMGAVKPEKGSVLIDNYKLSEWNLSDFMGRLEYLPPQGTLFKGTILDNITMFEPTRQAIAMDTAALLGLNQQVAQLPAGFQTNVTSLSNELFASSLIQRISIARALVVRPRVLLLDRTNQSMDRETENMFDWLLNHLKGEVTIIFVTNDIKYLQLADVVYQLENGHLEGMMI